MPSTVETMSRCTSLHTKLGNKSKEGIVIKSIPGNHQALHTFCKLAQKAGHKLFYAGDRAGVLAYRYMRMLTARKRETIPEDSTAALMEHQSNRCGVCGGMLRTFETRHEASCCRRLARHEPFGAPVPSHPLTGNRPADTGRQVDGDTKAYGWTQTQTGKAG